MEKLITFAIPSYNSGSFMHNAIDSILACGAEDIEIIIVNDGSKDNTGEVADSYAEKYPNIVRTIHQENGGHGEGVNQGIRNARGKYYKVLDSDDRIDTESLKKLLERMREIDAKGTEIDMYVCNYVYVRIEDGSRRTMSYKHIFPREEICTWDDTRAFGPSQYLMMHSVVYRTRLLRDLKFELPKHTFYVDNLYMYVPFPHVMSIYYMDLDLYLYYVGSDEQSVSEKNMIKRIDQQLLVTRLMIDAYELDRIKEYSRPLYRYMLHELSMMLTICSVFLCIDGSDESVKKQKAIWAHLKAKDPKTYRKLRVASIGGYTSLPGKAGRKFSVISYRVTHKIFKFN
ncbi:MAG: glycosyltransferase [Clostridia bacterium]|nr:glycosyltransferase [Clostridia bacterium]